MLQLDLNRTLITRSLPDHHRGGKHRLALRASLQGLSSSFGNTFKADEAFKKGELQKRRLEHQVSSHRLSSLQRQRWRISLCHESLRFDVQLVRCPLALHLEAALCNIHTLVKLHEAVPAANSNLNFNWPSCANSASGPSLLHQHQPAQSCSAKVFCAAYDRHHVVSVDC